VGRCRPEGARFIPLSPGNQFHQVARQLSLVQAPSFHMQEVEMKGSRFQLLSDTLATYVDDYSRDHLVLVPASSEVALLDDSLGSPSVRVLWNEWELAIFSEVLRREATQLDGRAEVQYKVKDEEEEDLSVAEQLKLVEQLLALSKRCWSRSLRSFDSELDTVRKSLLRQSEAELPVKTANRG
jgi:hypothetical protein